MRIILFSFVCSLIFSTCATQNLYPSSDNSAYRMPADLEVIAVKLGFTFHLSANQFVIAITRMKGTDRCKFKI